MYVIKNAFFYLITVAWFEQQNCDGNFISQINLRNIKMFL